MSDAARRRRGRCSRMLARRRAYVASAIAVVAAIALPASASAAIGFRAATQAAAQHTSGAWVARPADVRAGDVMVATVAVGGPHLPIAAAGWKPLRTTTPTTSLQQLSFYRVAGAYEWPAYYFGAGSGHSDVAIAIAAYSGVDAASPVDAVSDVVGIDAGVIPSVTTTAPGDVVVGAIALGSTATATLDPTVALRTRGGIGAAGVTVGDFAQPSAGASNARAYTSSAPTSTRAVQAIALRAIPAVKQPDPDPEPKQAPKGAWHLPDGTALAPGVAATLPVVSTKRTARVSRTGRLPVAVACP